ncbi:MAG TPA: hypothetical protein VFO41_08315 [Alphaproteobacteria bacterium]|nr:hypothetical protein [Alphaproteobacteria bacterium]
MWDRLGEALGRAIAGLVGLFEAIWTGIGGAVGAFFGGLARGLGLENAGLFAWAVIGFGLLLILGAIQGFLNRAVFGPLVALALGVALIGWIIA